MEYSIYSTKLKRQVTFSRPDDYYIYVDLNGKSGKGGLQICHGGNIVGSAIGAYGDNQRAFDLACIRWWKSFIRKDVGKLLASLR